MTVRSDIRNIGTVMNSEFKVVEARSNGVDNEFKLVRMEMASGFAAVDARFEVVDAWFEVVDAEFKSMRAEMREVFAKLPITVTIWVCSTMTAVTGVVATVAAIVINQMK